MTTRIPVKDTGAGNVILQMWEVDAEEAARRDARYVIQLPPGKAPPTKNPGGRGPG